MTAYVGFLPLVAVMLRQIAAHGVTLQDVGFCIAILGITAFLSKRQDTTIMVIPCLCSFLFTALRTLAAELVGAKPLHLLTQTVLLLKHPAGVFVAIANANL